MEFYSSNTSKDERRDYNITRRYNDSMNNSTCSPDGDSGGYNFLDVLHWLIICVGLPVTLVAIVALYSLIKTNHVTPVYVINLLISDLIQLCCLTAWQAGQNDDIISFTHDFGIMASIGFMVCVSMERYLVIAHPLWYRFRRSIKTSVMVCALVWMLSLCFHVGYYLSVDFAVSETMMAVFILLPLPLFIFFLGGTIRALSTSRSVPVGEKRRIVANLVVVLLIYTVMFLPCVIWLLIEEFRCYRIFTKTITTLLYCSPLADLTMYIFIRKGVIDRFLDSLCCCKMNSSQQVNSTNNDSESASWSQTI